MFDYHAPKDDKKKKGKDCPKIKSWGMGDGKPPLTTDPENPVKPFATYEEDDD